MQRNWNVLLRPTWHWRPLVTGLLLLCFVTSPVAAPPVPPADPPAGQATTDQPAASKATGPEASQPSPMPIAVEPTPAEPKPVEPIPVEPIPVEPIPVEPTPVEPTPVEPTPVEPTPVEPTPVVESTEIPEPIPEPVKASAPQPKSVSPIEVAPPIKISPAEKIPSAEKSSALPEKISPPTKLTSPGETAKTNIAPTPDDDSRPTKVASPLQAAPPVRIASPVKVVPPVSAAPPVMLAPELLPEQAKQAKALVASEIRSASFQGLTPGKSTREQVVQKLGEPFETAQQDNEDILVFQVGPFPKVKVALRDDVVHSIIINLAAPTAREAVAKELKLERFRPIPIYDPSGQLLGEVYPERGLMFAYDLTSEGESLKIGHVAIEPISGESFLLRAMREAADDYATCLSDLELVQQLLPDNAQSYWIQAIVLGRSGRMNAACEAAERAVALIPDRIDYQLTLIDLQRQQGQHEEALIGTQKVLSAEHLSPLGRAEAQLQWGRLLALTPPRDYKKAMEKTVLAVKLAATLTRNTPPDVRCKARQLVVESQLALATILAHGPWKQRFEVVPQWLLSAEQSAHDLIEKDDGDRSYLLSVYCTSLHCLSVLHGGGSPDPMADAAIKLGRTLISEAIDDDYRSALEWQLGTALWHAAQVELDHGQPEHALRYADNANALLVAAGKLRNDSPTTDHHLGQLHFLIGSIYALHEKDAASATRWYDKALPHLQKEPFGTMMDERGLLGEQLVSIGISYWEVGQKNKALTVTEDGARRVQEAVVIGTLAKDALAIPFENLVAMHKALGNSEKAQLVADKAAKIGVDVTEPKKQRR